MAEHNQHITAAQAAMLLDVVRQKHRLPATPVRAGLLEAYEARCEQMPDQSRLPVYVHKDGSIGTFRVRIPGFDRDHFNLRSQSDIGEIGLAWCQDREPRERVVVWRPLCGYPPGGGSGPDYNAMWRRADSISDAYAMVMTCLLMDTHPERAADVCYRAAISGLAGDTNLSDMVWTLGHRNIAGVMRDSDERPYYDPDEHRVVPALACRLTRVWHTRAFRVNHDFRGDMNVEPIHSNWSVASIHPDIFVVVMDHRRKLYDIRFGARINQPQRDVIEYHRGRALYSGTGTNWIDSVRAALMNTVNTTAAGWPSGYANVTNTSHAITLPDLSRYTRVVAPNWLTADDNCVMGLSHMSIPGTPLQQEGM